MNRIIDDHPLGIAMIDNVFEAVFAEAHIELHHDTPEFRQAEPQVRKFQAVR